MTFSREKPRGWVWELEFSAHMRRRMGERSVARFVAYAKSRSRVCFDSKTANRIIKTTLQGHAGGAVEKDLRVVVPLTAFLEMERKA